MKCNQIAAAVNLFHTSAHPQSPLPISRRLRVGLMAVAAVSLVSHTSQANPVVTDLGTLYGGYSQATAINNIDTFNPMPYVVGDSDASAFIHKFIGVASLLNPASATTGGDNLGVLSGDVRSSAAAINSSRDVVGTSMGAYTYGTYSRAFVYPDPINTANQMQDLNALAFSPTFILVEASGINSSGKIVGSAANFTAFSTHAYLFEP